MTRQVGVLLRDVQLIDGRRLDVRLMGGRIGGLGALDPLPGEEVFQAAGGALSVGLADHHLHLLAMAAAADSLDLGPRAAPDEAALATALAAASPDTTGWIRAVGYAGQLGGGEREFLDRLHPALPVRVQHRSGAVWYLNSAALARIGDPTAADADGGIWRADSWLAERMPPSPPPDLAALGRRLAGYGLTAVTDATPDLPERSRRLIAEAVGDGRLPQRVMLLGAANVDAANHDASHPRLSTGPRKILLSDHDLPGYEALRDRVRAARAEQRAVAVHCVTRAALALTIAVLDEVGSAPGDRIEHASLIDPGALAELRRLGLAVVTQPGFIADRGEDYLRDLEADDVADLYRVASLHASGVQTACSSDAPYGPADPWEVICAAAERTTPAGRVVGEAERTSTAAALMGYLSDPSDPGGRARRIAIGEPADLVLMHAPWAAVLAKPDRELVRCTFYGGQLFP